MRKLLKHTALFSLPLLLGWIVLINVEVPKEFSYQYTSGECEGQGKWLYSRFFLQDRPAGIVFIGASRTMRAVDDSLLQYYFDSTGAGTKILNAGFCRFGRDLFTLIAEDALNSQTGMQTLVFEVNEREGSGNHPVYWTLASTSDLFYPESFVNQSYFSNIYSGSLLRVDYLQTHWLGKETSIPESGKYFGAMHTDFIASQEELDNSLAHCSGKHNCNPPSGWEEFQIGYNKAWITRLASKAKEKNVELVFLFLPSYGCNNCPPRESEFYAQFGKVLVPPASILDDRKNWSDHDHMNSGGSRLMAKWLFEQLQD